MNMKIKLALLALSLAALTGCMTVPATQVTIDKKSGLVQVVSPKDVFATNVVVSVSKDGTVHASIGGFISKNSPEVLAQVVAANAEMTKETVGLLKEFKGAAFPGMPLP